MMCAGQRSGNYRESLEFEPSFGASGRGAGWVSRTSAPSDGFRLRIDRGKCSVGRIAAWSRKGSGFFGPVVWRALREDTLQAARLDRPTDSESCS